MEKIRGLVERITFRNDENLYTVLRLRPSGGRERKEPLLSTKLSADGLVTAVGPVPLAEVGGELALEGRWIVDPKFGEQFRIERAVPLPPTTLEGMELYLGSGLVHGIGKEFAKRLVRKFGSDTLDVIENEPEKLRSVPGIGPKRAGRIVKAWEAQQGVRDVMLFLHSHGVTPAFAVRIYKRYGRDAIARVKRNPYVLASEVHGIGFKLADRVASKLGIKKEAPERIAAGLLYTLDEAAGDGHCFLPRSELCETASGILEVDVDAVDAVLPALDTAGEIVIARRQGEAPGGGDAVYLKKLEFSESRVARLLKDLLHAEANPVPVDADKALPWAEKLLGITLAPLQASAVRKAIEKKICVITGGPGTGKTTIVRAVAAIIRRKRAKVLLCAPTGRAAKRLSEASRMEAKTIHRLLRWSPREGGFQHDESSPLECDLLVVDEMSMVDVNLMHSLLRAVPPGARLVLVGDADQLPSVGPGNVLRDILRSHRVPSVRLEEIFRQKGGSMIISNAHRINRGMMPETETAEGAVLDYFFVDRKEPEEVLSAVTELVTTRIPRKWGFDPVDEVQVLTPMHRGIIGAQNLNREMSQRLNPGAKPVEGVRGGHRIGDKVMQVRNNYDLDVYNGDIGRVTGADTEERKLSVTFDGRTVLYDYGETDELLPAYAVSIHKSQGSEFPAVVVIVSTSHYIMLQRNLIYTAVTRGKKLVVVCGTKKAIAIALKNDKVRSRYTALADRLRS
ncbi:MAG: ATP-dependent RecD-like DNA helicase [Deltaproteobacteria bacterium]|nr:ATP-dependent RecD-like DNA helicase [Deltaproteobacteria bacterium]